MCPARRSPAGRPEATSHAEIEQAAFRLFAEKGFEGTTLDDIAAAVGVSRRTLFRYYPSKNDIPWGQFDHSLAAFRQLLRDLPQQLPVHEVIHRGVLAFNEFPEDADPPHRERMRLIIETPALQAHSVLRYADWRAVIADYVAERLGVDPRAAEPEIISQAWLALALSAHTLWLRNPGSSLRSHLAEAPGSLLAHLGG